MQVEVTGDRVISNKNLLDNWYFLNPVNRNGKTEYTANGAFLFDRWQKWGGIVTIEDNGVNLKGTSSSEALEYVFDIRQPLTKEQLKSIIGKTVTLSVLAEIISLSSTTDSVIYFTLDNETQEEYSFLRGQSHEITNGVQLFQDTGKVSDTYNTTDYIRYTIGSHSTSAEINVIACKLELGDTQTLAHQENGEWVLNEVPNYAEQYAICEQYSPITGAFVGSQHVNRNLLDNWYFVGGGSQQGGGQFPINQRGQTEYTGPVYTIDRWKIAKNLKLSIHDGGIQVENVKQNEPGVDNNGVFEERIPSDLILGRTVTYSVLIGDELYTTTGTIPEAQEQGVKPYCQINFQYGWANLEVNTNVDYVRVGFCITPAQSMLVRAIKLELGDHQTLAHKEGDKWVLNEVPDYGEELAKCQRYQLVLTGELDFPCRMWEQALGASIWITTPVPMRIAPVYSLQKGDFLLRIGEVRYTPTAAMACLRNQNIVTLRFNEFTVTPEYKQSGIASLNEGKTILLDANL